MVSQIFFHLAFPVHNLQEAKHFYVEGLGCKPGRISNHSIIFNLMGNQIVAQLVKKKPEPQKGIYPRHFGLIFKNEKDWQALICRAKEKGLKFYQEPKIRFPNTKIEHQTFFLEDPSHNLLEFKNYKFESAIFAEDEFTEVGDTKE